MRFIGGVGVGVGGGGGGGEGEGGGEGGGVGALVNYRRVDLAKLSLVLGLAFFVPVIMVQVLVRGLEGRTLCLRVRPAVAAAAAAVTAGEVKAAYEEAAGVPAPLLRLVTGRRCLLDGDVVGAGEHVAVLLRLRGGKGGFGSLLRGASAKAYQKKPANYDACRDLNGRRIRHVTAEKQLANWQADAKDRELEKVAMEHMKQMAREQKQKADAAEKAKAVEEISMQTVTGVAEAVESGLQEELAQRKRKGKAASEVQEDIAVKKAKFWMMEELVEEDEDDDDEAEEGDDDAEGQADASDLRQSNGAGSSGAQVKQSSASDAPSLAGTSSDEDAAAPPTNGVSGADACDSDAPQHEGLDLSLISSAQELEALGLEGLKQELVSRGLKGGGSLSERASRLFLLKSASIDQIDRKHLASTGSK
eukprot:jgi/Chlat1/782/Chrsp104S01248